ncbi:MAG: dihydroorotase [Oscillospiraceae bacterium]|nr:dihydroorotase [Oscillospiraceae bacterium]
MKTLFTGLRIYTGNEWIDGCIAVSNGVIVSVGTAPADAESYDTVSCGGLTAFPGFADVHVHLREPGFSYKETIATGTRAAARGGYTAVCAMPNLNPVPDCLENLAVEQAAIDRDAVIAVFPYAAITKGEQGKELADLEALASNTVAFSDDGKGVQSGAMMEEAMVRAKALNKMIVAHCEDESLLDGICIHDGQYARQLGVKGTCSESEWGPIARDVELAAKTGVAYHVCHVSAKESVEIIRQAKARGVNITCETGPHYLVLCDEQLQDEGRFRMNPPIRAKEDQEALIQGLLDGTVDCIATDHAPHSAEEKAKGITESLNGIVGLETCFAALYTHLVKPGRLSLEALLKGLIANPRTRFGLGGGSIKVGTKADFTIFDLNASYQVDPEEFQSMGKSSPFTGDSLYGRCRYTIFGDCFAWRES